MALAAHFEKWILPIGLHVNNNKKNLLPVEENMLCFCKIWKLQIQLAFTWVNPTSHHCVPWCAAWLKTCDLPMFQSVESLSRLRTSHWHILYKPWTKDSSAVRLSLPASPPQRRDG